MSALHPPLADDPIRRLVRGLFVLLAWSALATRTIPNAIVYPAMVIVAGFSTSGAAPRPDGVARRRRRSVGRWRRC